MLTNPSNELELLNMQITKLSSRKTIALFDALKSNNTKLRTLNVTSNDISNDASEAIIAALQKNVCLHNFAMDSNPMTGEVLEAIVNGIKTNNTLQQLTLPGCPEDIKTRIMALKEQINEIRKSQEIQPFSIHFSSSIYTS